MTLLWAAGIVVGGDVGVVLPAAVIIAALAGFVCWQAALRRHWALLTVLVAVVFLLNISFRSRDMGEAGLDWQNGMKLLSWVGMMAICLLNTSRLAPLRRDPVIMAFGCYSAICMISTLYSTVPLLSSTAAFGLASYIGFGCLLAIEIPARRLLVVLLWTLAALCAVNLLAALVLPDVAWFEVDPIQEPGVLRFQGVSGHPNTLARISTVFALVVIVVAYYRYVRPMVWIALALLAAFVTLATESRTAILAVLLSLVLQIPRRYLMPILAGIIVGGGAILFTGQVDAVLALIGRDGSVAEAESMSGRTDLWQFAWDLIVARPLAGYGFNSFEAFAGTLWVGPANAAVVATHSNYLSVLYSTGIFGAIPFLVGFAYLLHLWWSRPNFPRDLFVFNVLTTGFSETDVFTTITTIPSLIFFMILALDAQKQIPAFDKR